MEAASSRRCSSGRWDVLCSAGASLIAGEARRVQSDQKERPKPIDSVLRHEVGRASHVCDFRPQSLVLICDGHDKLAKEDGLTYEIRKNLGIVISKAPSALTVEHVIRLRKRLQADSDFCPEFSHLFDLSEVINVELTVAQIREFADSSLFSSRSPHAYVVKTPLAFGIVRMYGTYSELAGSNGQWQIFDDRDKALAWLLEARAHEELQSKMQ
jgi:hypothetical protein